MQARRALRLLALTAIGVAVPFVAAAAPVTVEFPSSSCPNTNDTSLQQCIDGVDPGSTVVLVSEINDQVALIAKSLTLRAVDSSLHPILTGVLIGSPSSGSAKILVQDVQLTFGARVLLNSGSGHSVTISRVNIGNGSPNPGPIGIQVQADVPSTITIESSIIRRDQEDETDAVFLGTQAPSGLVRFRIVGNRITAHGDTKSNAGIKLDMETPATVRADIYNNVIWDVATCNCGAASGIAVLPDPTTRADVNIVGNTIDNSFSDAIQQRNDMTTGRLALDVFNNVFTHNHSAAVDLDSGNPGSLLFRAGYNDSFANGFPNNLDGQSAGPGNLNVDPHYVNRGARDFRIRSDSPLINKGSTCSLGGVADPDAAGRHRLNGPAVDIGAFESGGPAITGVVRVGTDGPDTLTGSPGDDILCGYGGADLLQGGPGADYIDGGTGPDHVIGGIGIDRVFGGPGDDRVCTRDGTGGDLADGGPGTDKADTDPGDIRTSVERPGGC